MEFHFEKPVGFEFKPGQNADWTLLEPVETDVEGPKRTFSFTSAPFEPELVVATRMRPTAFKRVLGSMPLGAGVQMEGPFGSMTLHHDTSRSAVFLAGGIGITPFRSIVRQALHDGNPTPLTLFYSNRRPEDTAFLTELEGYHAEGGSFRLIATMTERAASQEAWEDEIGFIDAAMLKRYLADLVEPIYYISGPPVFVTAMQKMLEGAGTDPDRVRSEEFVGY